MKVTIEMPDEAVQRFVTMFINGDLAQLRIQSVNLLPDAINTVAHTIAAAAHTIVAQPSSGTPDYAQLIQDTHFRGKFRRALVALLQPDDIQNICYDMQIQYANIPGDNYAAKVRELLAHCERNNMLEAFVRACLEENPFIRQQLSL